MKNEKITLERIKKRTKKFKRHHSDRYMRVKESWRKPKGIDNCVRRKFSGAIKMPGKGYRSDKRTRYVLENGTYKYPIRNVKDLDALLLKNKSHSAEISHGVSSKKRVEIVKKAQELGIFVLNGNAKIISSEAF